EVMAGRAPGWGTAAFLALACAGLSVVGPAPLIFVPLAVLLVGAPPVQPRHVVLGLALGALVFHGGARQGLWLGGRGWALLVGAWFLVAVLALPRATFLDRGLAALAGAAGCGAVVVCVGWVVWSGVEWCVWAVVWWGGGGGVGGGWWGGG